MSPGQTRRSRLAPSTSTELPFPTMPMVFHGYSGYTALTPPPALLRRFVSHNLQLYDATIRFLTWG